MPAKVFTLTLIFAALLHPGCSAADKTKDQQEHNKNIPADINTMAPETVSVNAIVRNLRSFDKDSDLCDLEISQVNGYGQAAPPLAAGSVLQVIIPFSLSKDNHIQNNNSYRLTISHLQLMKNQNIPEWRAIEIK